MFEHSVKVPRHYKVAANIFKKVCTEGGSVKTLLYDEKLRHFRTNVLYALITETIKHANDIDQIFDSCNLLTTEARLDPWLAKVLTAELLFGKKTLPGKSKPELTILSYKDKFAQYTAEHQDDLKTEVIRRPRYVRINTNLLTTSDAIREFQDLGFRFIRCTSGSYDDYLNQIQKLNEDEFTQDYHVKTVYVFAPGTKFHDIELCYENKIILQDKATTLAAHLLAPPTGSVVMDMCAAPGMKTTQLSAVMRNEGKIYAVERNEDRYNILCEFVKKAGCKNVETIHKDSLEIRRGDYDDVEYILLDPSCSGSGMELSVHNYIDEARLAKLTSLQEKFLKHTMNSFPKAKRIVYSTCSLFPEENERVVTNAVKVSRSKWRVQDVKEMLKGQWNNFGSNMYGSIGMRCLYARPDKDLTTGFFLAVLDRDQKEIDKLNKEKTALEVTPYDVDESVNVNKKRKKNKDKEEKVVEINQNQDQKEINKLSKEKTTSEVTPNEEVDQGVNVNKKKKKNKIRDEEVVEINLDQDQREIDILNKEKTTSEVTVNEDIDQSVNHKKKKKKNKDNKVVEMNEYNEVMSEKNEDIQEKESVDELIIAKKKKKKSKNKEAMSNCIDEETNENDTLLEPGKLSKNEKKKDPNKTEQNYIDSENIEVSQKSMKKKKKYNNDLTPDLETHQEVQDEYALQPKKKKKRKTQE